MKKSDTTLKLLKIDPLDKDIQKPPEMVELGTGAKLRVSAYKKSPNYKSGLTHTFYKGAILFLSNLTAHFIQKCPLKYMIVRCSGCLNPNILAISDKHETAKLRFGKMVEKLTSLGQITVKLADDAKDQFTKFVNEVIPQNREKFVEFSKFDQRLDTFLWPFISEYLALREVCILIFCLSHGQSAIERGFKANKEFIVENQSEESLRSLRLAHDHMLAKDVQAKNIKITRDMIKSVKASRQRYSSELDRKSKIKSKSDKELKRKAITEEIEQVAKKRRHLQSSIDELLKDADDMALKAQDDQCFKTLERSNDLRKAAALKKGEINEFNKMEETLILRRDSIV